LFLNAANQQQRVTIVLLLITFLLIMPQVTAYQLRHRYKAYIETVNAEQWDTLPQFLAETVNYNGKPLDNDGYIALIPADIQYLVADLVVDIETRQVASRLEIIVAGVKQTEHCFYQFTNDQVIEKVWSLVVKGEATGSHGQ
jgi:predicted ester cyclase